MLKSLKIIIHSALVLTFVVVFGQIVKADTLESNPQKKQNLTEQRSDDLQINLIYTHNVCYGGTGEIRLFIVSGTAPYTFQWSNGATSQDLYDVSPGVYEVTVTDDAGEQVVQTATINELPYLGSQINVNVQDVNCHSGNDGRIITSFQNDTGPYSYTWSNGVSTSYANDITAGVYTFTVTDSYSCEFDTVISISEPDTLYVSVYTYEATCSNSNDGMAWVDVAGGIPPDTTPTGYEYYYNWPSGATNDTMYYYGGTYVMSVSDANNCVVQVPFTIEKPDPIIALEAGDKQICIGGETNLKSEVTGGTPPFDYYWICPATQDTMRSNSWTVAPVVTTDYYFYAVDINGCTSNVVNSTVNVFPALSINSIIVSQDSICHGESVTVELEIEGGNGGPYQLTNMNTLQIVPSPFIIYPEETQTYSVRLEDGCTEPPAIGTFDITVMPDPQIGFNVDKRHACPPGVFYFNEFSPDEGQSYHWQFGDSQFSYDKNPIHIYEEDGDYSVALTTTSEFGCSVTQIKDNLITIYPKPDAEFYTSTNHASVLNPVVQFFNVSADADSIYWYYGDGDSTLYSHDNPWHEFEAVGMYNVKMVAENTHGCIDTTYKKIRIYDAYTFNAPNAFTPNNDGVNDCFRLCAHGVDVYEYQLKIYDRFGSIVFETDSFKNDIECDACGEGSWDGTYNGSYVKGDELCEPGVYAWYCVYKDAAGVDNFTQGKVTLIR